jgi:hypothetical protein
MIEYVVEIYNYGIPLANAITKENILSFASLYTTSSDFSLWCATNQKSLINMPIDLLYDYINDDLKRMISDHVTIDKLINTTYDEYSSSGDTSINAPFNNANDIPVFGGINPIYPKHKYPTIQLDHFCWCIIFYLFSPFDVKLDVLPKPAGVIPRDQQGSGNGKLTI